MNLGPDGTDVKAGHCVVCFDTARGETLAYDPFRHSSSTETLDRDSLTLDLQGLLLVVPVLLFSVIAHEYAHGYAALKQGDTTALSLGRLTWNPVKHIDPWMTILMPLLLWYASAGSVVLGGAKPVPVDPRNYRSYRRGDIIVSLAGVVTNLLIALACVVLIALVGLAGRAEALTSPAAIVQAMLINGVRINMMLIAFNLLPIPPLDGSHVVKHLLPPAWGMQYERLGMLGLFAIVLILWAAPSLLMRWLRPALVLGETMLGVVSGWILPSASAWVR